MSQDIADAAAGPTLAILFFIGFCITYAFMVPRAIKDNEMTRYILQTTLLFIGIIIQLGINWQTIQGLCGSVDIPNLLMSSFVPWLLIFGVTLVLLIIFTGWLQPFSNTIGYYLVYQFGNLTNVWDACFKGYDEASTMRTNAEKILKDPSKSTGEQVSSAEKDLKTASTIEQILNKSWLIINNIPPNKPGFEQFWKEAYENNLLLDDEEDATQSVAGLKLYELLSIKRIISEVIWFGLVGVLSILVSNNLVLEQTCNISPEDLQSQNDIAKSTMADIKSKAEAKTSSLSFLDYGH